MHLVGINEIIDCKNARSGKLKNNDAQQAKAINRLCYF